MSYLCVLWLGPQMGCRVLGPKVSLLQPFDRGTFRRFDSPEDIAQFLDSSRHDLHNYQPVSLRRALWKPVEDTYNDPRPRLIQAVIGFPTGFYLPLAHADALCGTFGDAQSLYGTAHDSRYPDLKQLHAYRGGPC